MEKAVVEVEDVVAVVAVEVVVVNTTDAVELAGRT